MIGRQSFLTQTLLLSMSLVHPRRPHPPLYRPPKPTLTRLAAHHGAPSPRSQTSSPHVNLFPTFQSPEIQPHKSSVVMGKPMFKTIPSTHIFWLRYGYKKQKQKPMWIWVWVGIHVKQFCPYWIKHNQITNLFHLLSTFLVSHLMTHWADNPSSHRLLIILDDPLWFCRSPSFCTAQIYHYIQPRWHSWSTTTILQHYARISHHMRRSASLLLNASKRATYMDLCYPTVQWQCQGSLHM